MFSVLLSSERTHLYVEKLRSNPRTLMERENTRMKRSDYAKFLRHQERHCHLEQKKSLFNFAYLPRILFKNSVKFPKFSGYFIIFVVKWTFLRFSVFFPFSVFLSLSVLLGKINFFFCVWFTPIRTPFLISLISYFREKTDKYLQIRSLVIKEDLSFQISEQAKITFPLWRCREIFELFKTRKIIFVASKNQTWFLEAIRVTIKSSKLLNKIGSFISSINIESDESS